MTAKEKQTELIKTYLKPTLKNYGYKTAGQTWWKDMGDLFIVINLQNSQWNSKEDLSFCFNIGMALTRRLKDKNKAGYFDIAGIPLRHQVFLSENRNRDLNDGSGGLGYRINNNTNLDSFIIDFKRDFEDAILKVLDELKTIEDWIIFYNKFEVLSEYFKRDLENEEMTVN
jgi:hypothetical protein